jgi:ATP-binding cassette subfamily B protein
MVEIDQSIFRAISRVYWHLTPRRRRQVIILGILIVVSSFVEAISISAILPFLAALTDPETLSNMKYIKPVLVFLNIVSTMELRFAFTLLFLVLILVSGLFRIIFFWAQSRLSMAIGVDFSVQVYENTLHEAYGELIKRNSSEILAGAQKAKDLVGSIIQPALTLISSIFMLVVVLVTLFAIEPVVAITGALGFGGLYAFVTSISKRSLKQNSCVYAVELERVNKAIQEVGGIRDIIIDGTQDTFSKIYRGALTRMQYAAAGNLLLSQLPRFVIEMLGMLLLVGITFMMIGREGGFTAAIPALGAVALGAQRLLPVLQQAYAAFVTIRGGLSSTTDALNLLDRTNSQAKKANQINPLCFNKVLRLENLSFRYQPNTRLVLRDISLEIKHGDRVGLIGATGSGKSTLIDLIIGLLNPTEGHIYIDGVKLCQTNIRNWHSKISHVPQSIYLADTTIAENIAFGVEKCDIDMARVRDAARVAQLSQTIESFPRGYQTFVGERGIRLSGGQRQRIGLARAIYKRSKVLILDEATSALDNETEINVMDAIERLAQNTTIIMVAHRLSTLKCCNHVFELKDGEIFWDGTYRNLEAKYNLQS